MGSSVALCRGRWASARRARSAGLAACAARLPFAYLVRRGGWANSLRSVTLKHAQPTSPRLPSVALGGLNGPAAPKPIGPGTSLTLVPRRFGGSCVGVWRALQALRAVSCIAVRDFPSLTARKLPCFTAQSFPFSVISDGRGRGDSLQSRSAALFHGAAPVVRCDLRLASAGASLIPNFRDHYVQTI